MLPILFAAVGFVLPANHLSVQQPRTAATSVSMAVSGLRKEFGIGAKEYGSIGSYMAVREKMVQAFNGGEGAPERSFIDIEECGKVMEKCGESLSEQELADFFKEADQDGDGKILFEHFCFAFCESAKRDGAPAEEKKGFFGLF